MSTATKANGTAVSFGNPTFTGGGTITVTHVVLKSSGTVRFVAPLSPNRTFYSGDGANFPIGTLLFTLAGTGGAIICDNEAKATLDAWLGSTTLGPATYTVHLYSAAPAQDGTGGTEFPATGTYASVSVTNDATNFPAASMV